MFNISKPGLAPKQAPPTKIIRGQYIAKASRNYPPRSRAEDAAGWIDGKVQIKPTVKLAAAVFGTSVPLVMRARDEYRADLGVRKFPINSDGTGPTLSDATLDRIVSIVGPSRILHALDRVTAPELQAAE